jgi:cyclophilin family peptidyl-prolyl cis-trans isomerase
MKTILSFVTTAALLSAGAAYAADTQESLVGALALSAEALALPAGTPVAVFAMADGKTFEVELFPDEAPATTENFVELVNDGYYDGIKFHRVEDWVVQAGDARTAGREEYVHYIEQEPGERGFGRGAFSMARLAAPRDDGTYEYKKTSGTQFFVIKEGGEHLNGNFCVFGWVMSGMEDIDALSQGDTIEKVTVVEVPAE